MNNIKEFLLALWGTFDEVRQSNPVAVYVFSGFFILVLILSFFRGCGGSKTESIQSGTTDKKTGGFISKLKNRGKKPPRDENPPETVVDPNVFQDTREAVDLQLSSQESYLNVFKSKDSSDEMWAKSYDQLNDDFVQGFTQAMGMNSQAVQDMEVADRKLEPAREALENKNYKGAISAANRAVKSEPQNLLVHTEARQIRAIAFKELGEEKKYNIEKQKAGALNYLSFRYAFPEVTKQIESSTPGVNKGVEKMMDYFSHVSTFEVKKATNESRFIPEERYKEERKKFDAYSKGYPKNNR